MAGTFKIEIQGDVLRPGDQQLLVNALRPRVELFTRDYDISVFGFIRKSYRIEISGTPQRFENVDNFLSTSITLIKRYLSKWKIIIKINLIESS